MSYAGDVTPDVAWQMLHDNPRAVLVDVRTDAEWAYVGLPDLGAIKRNVVRVSWQLFPSGQVNLRFVAEVTAKDIQPDQTILFLCRSGARSKAAAIAMTAAGFKSCFNVAEGFEGDRDGSGHRGKVGGWKARELPWGQS
ncbi:MAG: rhodanese-like domain-containing protein [Alphaproteobacteria bacterium]|nr:rhodanese-like domain-containing protein [Alphaproteobacteria bacterium]